MTWLSILEGICNLSEWNHTKGGVCPSLAELLELFRKYP
jgi:hypothetical protein